MLPAILKPQSRIRVRIESVCVSSLVPVFQLVVMGLQRDTKCPCSEFEMAVVYLRLEIKTCRQNTEKISAQCQLHNDMVYYGKTAPLTEAFHFHPGQLDPIR